MLFLLLITFLYLFKKYTMPTIPSFKEFKELHVTIQNVLISFFILPFWYVSLRLFTNTFFDSNSFTTVVIFCFCFNMISYLTIETYLYKILKFQKKNNESFNNLFNAFKNNTLSVISILINIVYLSLFIFVYYVITVIANIRSNYFFFCVFYYSFLFIILIILKRLSYKKNRKNDYN